MTPRLVAELAAHARTLRAVMWTIAAVSTVLLMVDVWDRAWLWALWNAVVLATAVSVARDVTRTLERLR